MFLLGSAALCALLYFTLPKLRSIVYDVLITNMTATWYHAVLTRLPGEFTCTTADRFCAEGTHLLDVGIGTGTALCKNGSILAKKKIRVTGVDYDKDYTEGTHLVRCFNFLFWVVCLRNIEKYSLTGCHVFHASIYEFFGGPYDAAYFSGTAIILHFFLLKNQRKISSGELSGNFLGSLMIMPDKVKALTHVNSLLQQNGKIYVTQTFQENQNKFLEFIKPCMRPSVPLRNLFSLYHSSSFFFLFLLPTLSSFLLYHLILFLLLILQRY